MLAILVSLALLIVLTFRKINIVVVGIAAAAVMALLSGQPVVTAVTDTYMTGAAQFVRDNFLLFFFSVLFGKVMEETGAAASIAKFLAELLGEKFAILGVIFSGAVLVYGGVTTLVVVFSLYPIALSLFKKANLPRYLLPGAIAGGCFTFACANFPGTPNLVNVIPTTYLGTNTMAAPLVGVITGIAVMLMVCVYFLWEASRARARGDCFVEDEATTQSLVKAASMVRLPSPIIAILPIVLILILLNVFKQHVVVAMLGGILLCVVLFFRNVHGVLDMFSYSAENSAIAIINTAVVVGLRLGCAGLSGISEAAGFRHQSGKYPAPAGLRPDDHHSGRRLRLRLRRFGYRPFRHGGQIHLPGPGPGDPAPGGLRRLRWPGQSAP